MYISCLALLILKVNLHVELVYSVTETLSPPALESFKEYARNFKWAKTHDGELEPYTGKYVAVSGEQIIAAGDTPEEIQPKVRGRVGVFISFVPERGLIWIL